MEGKVLSIPKMNEDGKWNIECEVDGESGVKTALLGRSIGELLMKYIVFDTRQDAVDYITNDKRMELKQTNLVVKSVEEARRTGKGICLRFREKESYPLAKDIINDGYKCPHCKKYDMNVPDKITSRYEIPSDIEFMNNFNDSYSWTENRKCGLCGKFYSLSNGC